MEFSKSKTLEQNLWSSKKISRIQIIVMLTINANPKQDLKIWFEANALVNATEKVVLNTARSHGNYQFYGVYYFKQPASVTGQRDIV